MDKTFGQKSFYSTLNTTPNRSVMRQGSNRMGGSVDPNKTFTNAATNAFFSNPQGRGLHYSRPINNRGNHYG